MMQDKLEELPLSQASGLNFRMWEYRVSHSVMLWRSYKMPTAFDLVFLAVKRLDVICNMNGLVYQSTVKIGDYAEHRFSCDDGEVCVVASDVRFYRHDGGPFFDTLAYFT